jgi:hypothetical protein
MKQLQVFTKDYFLKLPQNSKRERGQYFTKNNIFTLKGFKKWASKIKLDEKTILEPFAGANHLIEMLKDGNLCKSFKSFDIEPKAIGVAVRDTLLDFPTGFEVCITNPPYLARNSATRRGLSFPDCQFDDMYKFALEKCLQNCEFVGAIIPASFITSGLFLDRLETYISLNTQMFDDTEHPVCLALFGKSGAEIEIWDLDTFVGYYDDLKNLLPTTKNLINMRFNAKNGNLGLVAIDNNKQASIRFCKAEELNDIEIKNSTRSITKIQIDIQDINKLVNDLNEYLHNFRTQTADIFLTAFKGIRTDEKYRRRLDYALAKKIINQVVVKEYVK